jgi:hypothetical protein
MDPPTRTAPVGSIAEILKGTLKGIPLAILSGRTAYCYEITAWLREQRGPLGSRSGSISTLQPISHDYDPRVACRS